MDFDVIPYEDIVWGDRIGGGSFGSVFRGQYLGIDIAIKEIHASNQYDVHKYFEREWRIMSVARHPNIVLFLGLSKEPDGDGRVFIVSEYVPRGNLRTYIRSKTPFPWRLRLSYATDIARAVAYLHARQCIHRDLKSDNLLICANDRIKVADFGFARITGRNAEEMRHMTYCGTDGYMSPEIIMGEEFDLPADVWSLGIIFIELATRVLVSSKTYARQAPIFVPDEAEIRRRLSPGCPPGFLNLAMECCQLAPGDRPKLPEILARLRELERGLPETESAEHVGSLRLIQREGKRAMPLFDAGSSLAMPEVLPSPKETVDMDEDELVEEIVLAALAHADVKVDGGGASAAGSLVSESSSWRAARFAESATPSYTTAHEIPSTMPLIPSDVDRPGGSSGLIEPQTIIMVHSERVTAPPSPDDETTDTLRWEKTAVEVPKDGGSIVRIRTGSGGSSDGQSGTSQSSAVQSSAKSSTESSKSSKTSASGMHRFTLVDALISGKRTSAISTSFAFAFFTRTLSSNKDVKDKCVVCTKRLGPRSALQCDDCGILVHAKCSSASARNCTNDSGIDS